MTLGESFEEYLHTIAAIGDNTALIHKGDYVIMSPKEYERISNSDTANVREGASQPVFACSDCDYEEFNDKFGSYCTLHYEWLSKMFKNEELTLEQIGCRQFVKKQTA